MDPSTSNNQSYEIVSVQRAEPPAGAEGSEWCAYVITQGSNTIRGCRQGSRAAVSIEVEAIVVRLNERRLLKGARKHIVLRGRKAAAG